MFQYKDRFTGYGISIIKIKRPWGRLIFIMEILILGRRHHFIENALRQWSAQCPFLQMLEYLCHDYTRRNVDATWMYIHMLSWNICDSYLHFLILSRRLNI